MFQYYYECRSCRHIWEHYYRCGAPSGHNRERCPICDELRDQISRDEFEERKVGRTRVGEKEAAEMRAELEEAERNERKP